LLLLKLRPGKTYLSFMSSCGGKTMDILISKLTSKHQTTVPKAVRDALKLSTRDHIGFEILTDNTVILRRITPLDFEYYSALKHTLSEWESDDDEKAYGNL
jgi:antitoxin PrlF